MSQETLLHSTNGYTIKSPQGILGVDPHNIKKMKSIDGQARLINSGISDLSERINSYVEKIENEYSKLSVKTNYSDYKKQNDFLGFLNKSVNEIYRLMDAAQKAPEYAMKSMNDTLQSFDGNDPIIREMRELMRGLSNKEVLENVRRNPALIKGVLTSPDPLLAWGLEQKHIEPIQNEALKILYADQYEKFSNGKKQIDAINYYREHIQDTVITLTPHTLLPKLEN